MSRSLPITVLEWPRNERETIRVRLDHYKGRAIIDVRTWWRDKDAELRPGRSGLTLSIHHLPDLADAFSLALECARKEGLIEQDRSEAA
jgi:hypothetical protein